MNASVIVCTWNRSALLDKTLGEMRNLRIPLGVKWELLVVNNNCSDETDTIITRHSPYLPLRRLFEPAPGKSFAANLALSEAKGDLLLWTDDDVLVHPDWLAEYLKAAQEWPQAGFFGGTIDPWLPVAPPGWVARNLSQLSVPLVIRQLGEETRPFRGNEIPWGANMCFRRTVLTSFAFDPTLGPNREKRINGEDIDIILRVSQAGYQGVWVGPARVRHFIPPERLTRRFIWRNFVNVGRSSVRRDGIGEVKTVLGVPRWALRQYWAGLLKSWCLAPFKGSQWMTAFRAAAIARGMIEECRENPKQK